MKITTDGSGDVQTIANVKIEIYACVTPDIITDEVIITDKQVKHIFDRHPEKEHTNVLHRIAQAVTEPDYILADSLPNTAVIDII